ncbi:arsenic-transporting ATPase [Dissulfurispira thermophila]|uniref:arsenite-transporting ATPase n=1 Tax=Dissulfurispira thermophila TaxID=2715679 RepID=A0A7G1H5P0_9BACT|nr:TRC40/GET3/ArsA family transport-energizing ATPase [Dissulfurispira thermophila]BCB97057.1 arsenic-transporting ATPase [Dissulfurispira thermophila]
MSKLFTTSPLHPFTQYIFFSGKGGVGKTTMACATAIHHATEGKKTLIVTTDPASNLADVFEQEIGHKITPIKGIDNLSAMEIDPDEATREYKEKIIAPFREIMPDDVIASIDEQLSGPCTTEMAAFDRFIDFMEGDEYDVIVFDTAPTGHTIRLLELPVDWSKHIEESAKGSGQTCLGPVQTIQESKDKYDRATALLKNPDRTRFIFVMRPEELSLYETLRASKELESIGIKSGEIIINGILPEEVCEIDFFKKKYESQQKVIKEIERIIDKPKRYMLLRNSEVKGINALKDVAQELFTASPLRPLTHSPIHPFTASPLHPFTPSPININRLWLPQNKRTKALFFTGKGGVGKTTVSCLAALYTAQKGFRTLLVTTDPAAHIGEVLDVKVGSSPVKVAENLYAVMVDQETAFKEYKERVLNDARGKYSEDMIAAMEEELNSPCTEEMAAFDKFIQFIEGKDYEVIVFDTAPTGHTLRLLSLPFDYAKQVEMMVSSQEASKAREETQDRFREIINILKDKDRTVFSLVLYPESTPILESYRAMLDLKDAGIETQLVVANLILPEEVCINDFFKSRRAMQMRYLREINDRFNLPVLQIPMMQDEIRGLVSLKNALQALNS